MSTRRIFAVIAIVACLACVTSARTTQYLPEQGVLFEQALAQLRLDPADVRIDQQGSGVACLSDQGHVGSPGGQPGTTKTSP